MLSTRPSDCFKLNIFFWKIFGIWPGRKYTKFYKYVSATYLLITWIIYNFLLTLNLFYSPRKIDLIIREATFYFNEVAITAQVLMILKMRVEIFEIFEYLDCNTFEGNDDISKSYIKKAIDQYNFCHRLYLIFCHFAYVALAVFPVIRYWITSGPLELPISKYYFLTDEHRDNYFIYWYIYQSLGIYGHMTYDINIDSFIVGLMLMAITQLKVINYQLSNMKLNSIEATGTKDVQETIFISKLKQNLRHYELVLKYCARVTDVIRVTMFVQFSMSSAVICAVLYGLLLPSSMENIIFMVVYLGAMTTEIFVPGWLGTQLSYESGLLVSSAYNIDWLPRSQSFKRSLKLFIVRANIPIKLHLYMFHLNLESFLAIMKTAYSCFSLLRNVQSR
ncbi:odorant receptor 2a-like [Hyposmocoma kahamanoa]|uniref:odorant receptor 2a-like n=1 Tax=Hyposmocoma kahamanoa TaxID=1477025 RepID=UPI000E6D9260|nr:odorant receptor 2a-like [Hyposmocoma kahamanoa]